MVLDQSIKATALLDCRQALFDIQATQLLTLVSSQCSVDHKAMLKASLLIRDRHRLGSNKAGCPPFWTSPEVHEWNVGRQSSSITIRAYFRNRFYIRDFCTNIIQQLRNADIAVLWIFKSKEQACFSVIEVLKSLIHQALTLGSLSSTDSKHSSQMHQFLHAHSDKEYTNFLASTLERFGLVYVIVEAGAMDSVSGPRCRDHLQEISRRLSELGAATVVKIMLFGYGPDTQNLQNKDSILLKIGRASHRKGKKIPSDPLQSAGSSEYQQSRRNTTCRARPFRAQRRTVRVIAD